MELTKLVVNAQAGDEESEAALLLRLGPMFRGFFIKRIGVRPEVDDLVQNTLVRVHKSLVDLKHPDRLKGFAMKAALFELQDYYRGRYSGKEVLFDAQLPPDHAGQSANMSATVDVQRALATLSPKARKIIELREYGYRYEEIASMIGTTEAAIKMQVKRAFNKLRDYLALLLIAFGNYHSFWRGL